ncbi:hypothetical protein NP493_11g02037 [Ridgeia piscesae]|uniref:Protein FRA10AC1 n=1 Tax=Ridgeia piscesae TaxID=27915 RepID=A0AAD9PF87_RIDPI|nr:hypothetical protein NP493_11g02037 [Ridgeia piscesae]
MKKLTLTFVDQYARHKKYINDYLLYYCGSKDEFKRDTSRDRTDIDVIRENHRFLWQDDDDAEGSWEKRLAKSYYDKLFKEYCIADLSYYKENKQHTRLCPDCSYKLNYRHKRKEVKGKRKSAASGETTPPKKHKTTDMQEKTKDDVHPESTGSGEGHEVDTHGKEAGKKEGHVEDKESSLWSGPAPVVDETTREDEFQEYFEGMFM